MLGYSAWISCKPVKRCRIESLDGSEKHTKEKSSEPEETMKSLRFLAKPVKSNQFVSKNEFSGFDSVCLARNLFSVCNFTDCKKFTLITLTVKRFQFPTGTVQAKMVHATDLVGHTTWNVKKPRSEFSFRPPIRRANSNIKRVSSIEFAKNKFDFLLINFLPFGDCCPIRD